MKLRRVMAGALAVTAGVAVAGYAIIASLDVQQVADFARAEVKAATGRALTIAGPVGLKVSLTPAIELQDVRFANAAWGSRPDLVTIRRLEIEVALLPLLFGDVVVQRLVAIEPDILLEIDAAGRGNWEFGGTAAAAAPPPEAEAAPVTLPDVQAFSIRGGVLRLVDAAAGEVLQLEVREAVGSLPGGGDRRLRLAAAYNGEPFVIEGTYGGLPALLSGVPVPVEVTLEAGGARVTAKGTAGNLVGAARADLAVSAAGQNLAGLSPLLGADLPAVGPYELSGKVKFAGKVIDLSGIALKVGASDLTGNLTLSLAAARPSLKGALVSKLLDLDDLTGDDLTGPGPAPEIPAGATPAGAGGGGDALIFPDTPLPLAALRAVDARVTLTAERLRLGGHSLDALRADLALQGGDLTLAPLTARLAGGSLTGQMTLAAARPDPAFALALDGRDIDFGDLLQQAGVTDGIGGPLELSVDLSGRGASPHAIAAGLDGHLQAVAVDGTVDKALLQVLSAGLGDVLDPLFGGGEETRLECLVARFDITGGQAESRALVLDTGTFGVAGRGGIDLAAERVSLAFATETSQPSLASLAVPFRVTGPLRDPRVIPDPVGAAVGVVGTVGDVAKTGGNIVGGAVDAVGGIIGTGPIIGQIGSNQTLCGEALAAIDRAPAGGGQTGGDPAGGSTPKSAGGLADDVGDALEDAGQEIERGLESLFGN